MPSLCGWGTTYFEQTERLQIHNHLPYKLVVVEICMHFYFYRNVCDIDHQNIFCLSNLIHYTSYSTFLIPGDRQATTFTSR